MPTKMTFLAKQKKPPQTLRERLHRHLASPHEDGRPMTTLHASSVTKDSPAFCPREVALMLTLKRPPKPERISTSLRVTWDIGRYVEAQVAEWFAELGLAVGDWKCLHCGTEHKMCRRPEHCRVPSCGHRRFKYVELRVESAKTGVSCGIDLLLSMPGADKLRVVEIKSIDKDQFKTQVAPLAEHKARTQLYLRCVAESKDPRTKLIASDYGLVLYVSKGGFGRSCPETGTWDFWDDGYSPFNEYVVERDDTAIAVYVNLAMQLRAWRTDGVTPPRICGSSLDKRGGQCAVHGPCWKAPA